MFQSYIYSAPHLQYGVGDDDVVHAVSFVHGGVHRDLQTDEDQGAEAEHCMDTVVKLSSMNHAYHRMFHSDT